MYLSYLSFSVWCHFISGSVCECSEENCKITNLATNFQVSGCWFACAGAHVCVCVCMCVCVCVCACVKFLAFTLLYCV